MKKNYIIILFFLISKLSAQSIHETEFYKLLLPAGCNATSSPTLREEFSNIDSFMLFKNESPRYLVYIMSNKLTEEFDKLTVSNVADYLTDIGAVTVIGVEQTADMIKVKFVDNEKENISFIAYLKATNDILNRFVFFIPSKVDKIYDEEIREIVQTVEYKKVNW